jgi:hypothetical protein
MKKKTGSHCSFKITKSIVVISSVRIKRVHACPSVYMSACLEIPMSESMYICRSSVRLHLHHFKCMYMHMDVCAYIPAFVYACLHKYAHTKHIFIFHDNPRSFWCQHSLRQNISQNMISQILSHCNKQYLKLLTRSQNWHTKLELTGPCIAFVLVSSNHFLTIKL